MGIMWDIDIAGTNSLQQGIEEFEYTIRASAISITFTYTYSIPLIGKPIIIGG
jgi:hypothetical protein